MHPGEPRTDAGLVRRLLAAQLPHLAGLPVVPVASAGTDNALYRLGDDLVVRLPRATWAVDDVEKEQRWLPVLAPHLPLPVPVPVGRGVPGEGYPWPWSVYRWLPGDDASGGGLRDLAGAAVELAGFVTALQLVPADDGPRPGPSGRGVALAVRDEATRRALGALDGEVDPDWARAEWEAACQAPPYDGPPVWVHGDLTPGNLLVRDGRLAGVLDLGSLSTGDPAVDLLVAWNLLTPDSRPVYRSALGVDGATWRRGRGWALSVALVALPYYRDTNPAIVASSLRVLGELCAEPDSGT